LSGRPGTLPRGGTTPGRATAGSRGVAGPPWWRSRRALVVAAALLTALGVCGWLVGWTGVLGVRTVTVTGARSVPAADVIAAAAVPRGQPLARVNTGAVAQRVGAIPGVARVAVTRAWPSKVRIAITERLGVAVVRRDGVPWLIDGGGVVFQRLTTGPGRLPTVDVSAAGPDDPATRAALAALAALSPAVRAQVRTVAAPTRDDVRLTLSADRTVVWGDAGEAAAKAEALQALLSRPGHTYDVSTPNVVTVRP
jgi:cell division protein FtsQ